MAAVLTNQPTVADDSPAADQFVINGRPDFTTVHRLASEFLDSGLNRYQLRLNAKMLKRLRTALSQWLTDYDSEIQSQLKQVPSHAREKWLNQRVSIDDRRTLQSHAIRFLTEFLFQFVERNLVELQKLRQGNQSFRHTVAKIVSPCQREKAILRYAEELGASPAQLCGDERALARWFDEEAVTDRYAKQVGESELLLTFVLERISTVVDRCFESVSAAGDASTREERLAGIWTRMKIERRIQATLDYEGDQRMKVTALKCLGAALKRMPTSLAESLIDKRTLLLLHRTVVEARADVWVQCEALSLLASLSLSRTMPLLMQRLTNPRRGDDIFVRRHIYRMLSRHLAGAVDRCLELPRASTETSPFVRQAMAKAAFLSTHETSHRQFFQLAKEDGTSQVRAAAILVGAEVQSETSELVDFLQTVVQVLENENDTFVLRTAMHVVTEIMAKVSLQLATDTQSHTVTETELRRETVHEFYRQRLLGQFVRLQRGHEMPSVRRWAAQAREKCWMMIDTQARDLFLTIQPKIAAINLGQTVRLKNDLFAGIPDEKLGRLFAVLSQTDFGYDIDRGWFGVEITRGPVFGFRLWRLIFECTHTATDKRQALRHTVGRINSASMRAPSQIGGELSETKVPGEPVTIGAEGSWRPFLPLMDDFVSVLNRSWITPRKTCFYTSQGITKVTGPRGFLKRMKAGFQLNLRFARYADKRNWDEETYAASAYIESMQKLGFEIEFQEYDPLVETISPENPVSVDNSVAKFFESTLCVAPVLALSTLETAKQHFMRFADYFSSAFENTIEQLLVFTVVLLLVILGKHALANYRFRKARRNIPLSIGGWGTRGKSGTERLKAALIGAMGHGLVSKTTGCEAMFIHADPNGEPLEIPLFRPFDKATIWEQHNLMLMASRMDPSVFLWECMALTPSYVDVLSRQWTCDDLATITNTYPDHEDLQGPAGHDVATTISGFVPLRSHVLTTEEQMRPYITESCRHAGSTLRGVGWLESGLITDDVLERFPYKEHPDNVALVAAMGEELGVDYDFSLKAMGDYLVPDLGVLKTHPVATVRTRKIEFTNGMSANERFGCMGNIRRLGFDTQDPWDAPATWVSGVVNNRADRVPRSKVFAKIIVEDMMADRFFLIGNNLKGLLGMIEEVWEEYGESLSLRDQGQPWDTDFALGTLKKAAWNYRQPIESNHVQAKLSAMLTAVTNESQASQWASLWDQPESLAKHLHQAGIAATLLDSIETHLDALRKGFSEYHEFKSRVESASPQQSGQIESDFVKLLRAWYDRKLVVVENYDATGEEVVARIVDETPPGFLNRTIGLQNIKGTGLDFVYRFQAWDVCHEACDALLSPQTQTAHRGLQTLMSMPAIGQLCQQRLRTAVTDAKNSPALRRSDQQADLAILDQRIAEALGGAHDSDSDNDDDSDALSSTESITEWQSWMLERSEQIVDLNDSLRRRDTADRIYKDLANGRISRQRAVVELRNINKRQKGGWLTSALAKKSA